MWESSWWVALVFYVLCGAAVTWEALRYSRRKPDGRPDRHDLVFSVVKMGGGALIGLASLVVILARLVPVPGSG